MVMVEPPDTPVGDGPRATRTERSSPQSVAALPSEPLRGATGAVPNRDVTAPAVVPEGRPTSQAERVTMPPARLDAAPEPASAHARLTELVEREVALKREFRVGGVLPASGESSKGRSHTSVMVVDDSSDARTILSIFLSKTGFHVVTAASAEDCLAKLSHHHVDAIVLDARMPGASGAHVCRSVREDPRYAAQCKVPIIVYTAYPDEFSRETAREWRADEYVVKGGDLTPLLTALVSHTNPQSEAHP